LDDVVDKYSILVSSREIKTEMATKPRNYLHRLQVPLTSEQMRDIELEAIERDTTVAAVARAILVAHARNRAQKRDLEAVAV
jgi:hypothetical protein